MRQTVIIDTEALVAAIDRRDQFHRWVTKELRTIAKPLLTCEAVMTETCFLLQQVYGGQDAALALVSQGIVELPLCLDENIDQIRNLMTRYQSVPMSLADACLVRMSEQCGECVLTLDSDFLIYRKNTNQVIPVIMPGDL